MVHRRNMCVLSQGREGRDREQTSWLSTKLNEAVTMTPLAHGLSQALQSFSGYSMNRYLQNKQQK